MYIKKLAVSILLGTSILATQSFAATPSLTVVSLEEALRLSVYNDPELMLMDDKVALGEKELKQVIANADYLKTKTIYDKDEYVSNRKAYLLTPLKKENSVAALKRQRDEKTNNIKLELMTQYYDVLAKLEQQSDAKRTLETIEKEIEAKSKELLLGKITQLDYNSYEIKKIEAENSVNKANIDLEVSYMKFANIANKPIDFKFTPSPLNKNVTQFTVGDLESVLKNERSQNSELLAKQAAIKEMELEIKINTDSQYEMGNTDSATTILQNDLKAAQKDLVNIEASIDMNLRIDLYKLQSNYDSVLVNKSSFALAQKELDVAKVKYSVGTISLIDYISKQEALDKAESAYNSSITAYLTAVEKFKMNHFIK